MENRVFPPILGKKYSVEEMFFSNLLLLGFNPIAEEKYLSKGVNDSIQSKFDPNYLNSNNLNQSFALSSANTTSLTNSSLNETSFSGPLSSSKYFHPDMFRQQNVEGMQVILYFLFSQLSIQTTKEVSVITTLFPSYSNNSISLVIIQFFFFLDKARKSLDQLFHYHFCV